MGGVGREQRLRMENPHEPTQTARAGANTISQLPIAPPVRATNIAIYDSVGNKSASLSSSTKQ